MSCSPLSNSSIIIMDEAYPIFDAPVHVHWAEAAGQKGFRIVARIQDRFHFALECAECGGLTKTKLFVLMNNQPLCQPCLEAAWSRTAEAAGLTFLNRDPDRHYGWFRTECGHTVRRQIELVGRVADGTTGLRCEVCHSVIEAAEAKARGWRLLGQDPKGNPSYRMYRHDSCGHEQRIARVNLQSGRFGCGGCSEEWPAAPSFLYAMSFTLASGRQVVKLGFSRDPESRLFYQLRRDPRMAGEILRTVPMATGQTAINIEKALHRQLKRLHPDAVVDPSAWTGQLRIKTEIYDVRLMSVILGMLNEIARGNLPA